MVKEAIMSVLRLAIAFTEKWREGVEEFQFHEAEKMEVEFSRCSHFLVSCLNNVTKRGHFPHCECNTDPHTCLKPILSDDHYPFTRFFAGERD